MYPAVTEKKEVRRPGEERREEKGDERRGVGQGRRVKGGEKKGRNEICVCSVPQADTSLLSLAQSNHMPLGHKRREARKMRCARGKGCRPIKMHRYRMWHKIIKEAHTAYSR